MHKAMLILLLAIFSTTAAGEDKVVHLDSGEYAPYYSQSMPGYGVVSRIVIQAFALEGYRVEINWFPWARAYRNVANGLVHGSFTGAKTPEREKLFYYSDPIIRNEIVFFHLKQFPFTWNELEDISDIPIGGTLGYGYSKEFAAAEKAGKIKVERVGNDETNFRKLLGKRVKLFPISKHVGLYKLNQSFTAVDISSLSCHSTPLVSNNVHLILSKKQTENEQLLQVFNRGLAKLKQAGNYDKLANIEVESRIACQGLPVDNTMQNVAN